MRQSTLSSQIRKIEEALDEKLFVREGRNLVLTEVGRMVYRYADEIFSIDREMMDALRGRPTNRPGKLLVVIANVEHRITHPAVAAIAHAARNGILG